MAWPALPRECVPAVHVVVCYSTSDHDSQTAPSAVHVAPVSAVFGLALAASYPQAQGMLYLDRMQAYGVLKCSQAALLM